MTRLMVYLFAFVRYILTSIEIGLHPYPSQRIDLETLTIGLEVKYIVKIHIDIEAGDFIFREEEVHFWSYAKIIKHGITSLQAYPETLIVALIPHTTPTEASPFLLWAFTPKANTSEKTTKRKRFIASRCLE